MAEAYGMELRERVVRAYEAGEGSYGGIAARFALGEATVKRWCGGTGATDSSPRRALHRCGYVVKKNAAGRWKRPGPTSGPSATPS